MTQVTVNSTMSDLPDDSSGGFIPPLPHEKPVQTNSYGPNLDDANLPAVRPLSNAQERRLVEYLESQFLEIIRAFKKRAEPTTTLPDLPSYLNALHPLLSLILLIPPVDPSGSLRVSYLLRLTGEFFDGIISYPLISSLRGSEDMTTSDRLTSESILVQVLDWMTELDKGWTAVLNSQTWDPSNKQPGPSYVSTRGVTQTERTRLRSLVLQGREKLEDWLGESSSSILDMSSRETFVGGFWRTLSALGVNPDDLALSNMSISDDSDDSDTDVDYRPGGLIIT